MKKLNLLSLILILLSFFVASNSLLANYKGEEKDKGKKPALQKTTALNPRQSLMNINKVTMWVSDEGFHDWVVASSWNGAFPSGSSVGAIFAEGVVWGGQVNDGSSPAVRVNGNTYGTGCAPLTRLFRVRPDYLWGDLTDDAATFNDIPSSSVTSANIQEIRDQYAADWAEWPVDEGALYEERNGIPGYQPAVDLNNNGKFEPEEGDIPGVPGASQSLFIKYNDDLSESNYGSPPIGLVVSETYWAYAASGALGNVIFKKMDLIYTGTPNSSTNATIDSFFIVQWADPDVGTSSDDFAGCDTILNMGYAYSSGTSDATYAGLQLAPPAVGYDFLQGASKFTGDPNDSALFDLKWRKGYKYFNDKPMSSYIYFAAGGAWSDPGFNYNGTLEFYNLMRGKKPIPRYPSASPFPEEVTDISPSGTFLLAGDPVTGTGKIDGRVEGPGDRRIMVVNGPITLSKGDTAQIVLGLVYGLGRNNLSSISVMKYYDAFAQYAYDQLFDVPLMPPPTVKSVALDNEISIYWNETASLQEATENQAYGPYEFQAYSVYQLPPGSKDIADGIRVATYDVVDNISFLSDKILDENTGIVYTRPIVPLDNVSGVRRRMLIDKDYLNNKPLVNGQSYTFAVTAIGYKDDPSLPSYILESAPTIVEIVPQTTNPGVTYSTTAGDSIAVTHNGGSDGSVEVIVLDPTRVTGHDYKVNFAADGTWSLTDVTDGVVKLENQENQSGDENYFVVDGLLIKVIGPPVDINNWSFTPSAARWFTGVNAGGEQFFGGLLLGSDFFGSNITPDQYVTVELRFVTDRNNGQRAYRYLRGGTPSYGYMDYEKQYFTLWDVDANPPQQLSVAYVEQAGRPAADTTWRPTADNGDREYLFFLKAPYTDTPDPYFTSRNALSQADEFPTLYALWPLQRGTMPFNPQDGQVFKIVPNYSNTIDDEFTFKAPVPPSFSPDKAKTDVEKINVFPNPYYGYQYRETAPNNKYVTFNHLPDNAVIRIFDLSGVLVKTITHVPNQGQFETWNLANDNNYPVASGIYIVYIDMPDLGKTKIIKLAVIQEQQMLKVY